MYQISLSEPPPPLRLSPSVKSIVTMDSLMLFSSLAILFLTVITTYPRRSGLIKFMVTVASFLSIPVITYTVDNADAAQATSPLFIVSAVFLHLIYRMFASLDDTVSFGTNGYNSNKDERNKFPTRALTEFGWIGFLLVTSTNAIPFVLKLVLCLVLGLSILKMILRYFSFKFASESFALGNNSEVVKSYMNQLPPESDALLVSGEEKQTIEPCPSGLRLTVTKESDFITLDKILACEEEPLRDNERNKEVCVAFAIFKLLRGLFEGHPAADSSRPGSVRQLLLDGSIRDDESLFRIIEVELAFLHDCFFSTLPFTYYRWIPIFNVLLLFLLLLCCLALKIIVICSAVDSSSFLHNYYSSLAEDWQLEHVKQLMYLDVSVCLTVLMVPVVMEAWEIVNYFFSNWVRVVLLCKYVKNPRQAWVRKALHLLSYFREGLLAIPSGCRKLHQYSLPNRRIKKPSSIDIPDQVKQAISRSLRGSEGLLTDGSASLNKNAVDGVEEFYDASRLDSLVERTLVWHIATSHCEDRLRKQIGTDDQLVASCLSRYCGYLVTKVPELIPGEIVWTRFIAEEVANLLEFKNQVRPKCALSNFISMFLRMRPKQVPDTEEGRSDRAKKLVSMGRELGHRLMMIEDESWRWKILADLWAEMMLYMAGSSDVEAHADSLADGGQFITCIWALLYHAQIE